MPVTSVLGPACSALSIGLVWPQVARVYRARTVEGLSPKGTLHGLAGTALWTVYGIAAGVPPVLVTNLTVMMAMLAIGAAQVRHRVLAAQAVAATLVGVLAGATLAALVSPALAGWMAIAVGATSILPQTFHVLRAVDLSGVSVVMYGLLVVACVGWTTYGVLIGDALVALPNLIVLPCAVLITRKALAARRAEVRYPVGAPA